MGVQNDTHDGGLSPLTPINTSNESQPYSCRLLIRTYVRAPHIYRMFSAVEKEHTVLLSLLPFLVAFYVRHRLAGVMF